MFTIKADNGITYSHLTQKEQYLNLPNLVIGSVSYVKQQHTIYKSKKFTEKTIKISDALITTDRKSTRLNSSHSGESRMPSSA